MLLLLLFIVVCDQSFVVAERCRSYVKSQQSSNCIDGATLIDKNSVTTQFNCEAIAPGEICRFDCKDGFFRTSGAESLACREDNCVQNRVTFWFFSPFSLNALFLGSYINQSFEHCILLRSSYQ